MSDYMHGPRCPDCKSENTTRYPVDEEGNETLYCDDCKREELYKPEDLRCSS